MVKYIHSYTLEIGVCGLGRGWDFKSVFWSFRQLQFKTLLRTTKSYDNKYFRSTLVKCIVQSKLMHRQLHNILQPQLGILVVGVREKGEESLCKVLGETLRKFKIQSLLSSCLDPR